MLLYSLISKLKLFLSIRGQLEKYRLKTGFSYQGFPRPIIVLSLKGLGFQFFSRLQTKMSVTSTQQIKMRRLSRCLKFGAIIYVIGPGRKVKLADESCCALSSPFYYSVSTFLCRIQSSMLVLMSKQTKYFNSIALYCTNYGR